jgi:hypothetical protein
MEMVYTAPDGLANPSLRRLKAGYGLDLPIQAEQGVDRLLK